MSSKVDIAKFHGAEMVIDLIGERSPAYEPGCDYIEKLDVSDDEYDDYAHDDPVSELLGIDEVLVVMRPYVPNIGKAPSIRREIEKRARAARSNTTVKVPEGSPSTKLSDETGSNSEGL